MRAIIFFPLAIFVCAIFLSAFSGPGTKTTLITGKIDRVLDGGAITMKGRPSQIILLVQDSGLNRIHGVSQQAVRPFVAGQHVNCWQIETDSYGAVKANCTESSAESRSRNLDGG